MEIILTIKLCLGDHIPVLFGPIWCFALLVKHQEGRERGNRTSLYELIEFAPHAR